MKIKFSQRGSFHLLHVNTPPTTWGVANAAALAHRAAAALIEKLGLTSETHIYVSIVPDGANIMTSYPRHVLMDLVSGVGFSERLFAGCSVDWPEDIIRTGARPASKITIASQTEAQKANREIGPISVKPDGDS